MRSIHLLTILLTLLLISCGQLKPKEVEQEPISEEALTEQFAEPENLSEYARTLVVPTMEHLIPADSNSIYCATLLFAWDEVRKMIGSPLSIPEKYRDLRLLNASKSFHNVLRPSEYKASGEIQGDFISARAEFKKLLPFACQLQKYENKLTFDKQNVVAFGVTGEDNDEMTDAVEILYYKNDNNFIIKLIPNDKEHEIVLFKTGKTYQSMAEMSSAVDSLIKFGQKERTVQSKKWKYQFRTDDEVIIPDIDFDISATFDKLIGNVFSTISLDYKILQAWQRTAFKLNEMGAEVESQAKIILGITGVNIDEDKIVPKKMIFDKPFFLMLRRSDAQNPYFCLNVVNAELLVKE